MKRFLLTLAILLIFPWSVQAETIAGTITGSLTGTGPESISIGPSPTTVAGTSMRRYWESNRRYWITEVRARFSAATTTATDQVEVIIDSVNGAAYDSMVCAPDHDNDGTPSIGMTQYVNCSFAQPMLVESGSDVLFNFTNSDGLTGTVELVYEIRI